MYFILSIDKLLILKESFRRAQIFIKIITRSWKQSSRGGFSYLICNWIYLFDFEPLVEPGNIADHILCSTCYDCYLLISFLEAVEYSGLLKLKDFSNTILCQVEKETFKTFRDLISYFTKASVDFKEHCSRTAHQEYQMESDILKLRPGIDIYALWDYRAKMTPEKSLKSTLIHHHHHHNISY